MTLTGLKPGTRYVYRVVSREIVDFKFYRVTFGGTVISAESRFTTLDAHKPATSFVVLNDRHEKIGPLTASLASVKWTNVGLVFLSTRGRWTCCSAPTPTNTPFNRRAPTA